VLCVQQVCLGDGPTLKWKVRDWRPATEGRYRSYTVCYLRSNEGLSCDEAKSGSHRDRQIARSVARRPSTKGIDGTTNGASTLRILSHGRPPTRWIEHCLFKMEYSWSYNNGQRNSGSIGHGSYVNPGHIQQDNPSSFDDAPGFGYPSSQIESDSEIMNFEPHSNYFGSSHSTNHPYIEEPSNNMTQTGFDQMSLDFGEIDSQPDFNIGNPFDLAGVNHPSDNIHQASLSQDAAIIPSTGYAHAGKTITQMVKEQTNGEYQGYFTSRQHRKELEEQYMQQQAARLLATINPDCLVDLPGDDEVQLREWRRKIIEAIKDCTNVVNKDRIHEKKNEKGEVVKRVTIENTHVRRVRTLSLFETEIIADKILEAAEEAHQGNTGVAPWVEKSSWGFEQYPSFEMRMQAVLVALRKNKSVAHAYLQVCAPNRFVAAPKAEIKGKDENIACNGNRGQLIREGAKAKKAEDKKATGGQVEGETTKSN
ncbi:hypothetical protein GE21DRAFT_1209290, partial [Neurospora crassa]